MFVDVRRRTRTEEANEIITEPHGTPAPDQAVGHHLEKLVTAGLLDREQRGIWAYYSLNHDTMRRLAEGVALDNERQGASR